MKGFFINLISNSIGAFAVITGHSFSYNVFWAVTVIMFPVSFISVCMVISKHDDAKDLLGKYVEVSDSVFFRKCHLITDLSLLVVLFGCGNFVLGAIWFWIHIISDIIMREEAAKLESPSVNK